MGTNKTVIPGTHFIIEYGPTVISILTIVVVGEVWGAHGLTVVNAVSQRNVPLSRPAIPLIRYIITVAIITACTTPS